MPNRKRSGAASIPLYAQFLPDGLRQTFSKASSTSSIDEELLLLRSLVCGKLIEIGQGPATSSQLKDLQRLIEQTIRAASVSARLAQPRDDLHERFEEIARILTAAGVALPLDLAGLELPLRLPSDTTAPGQ